MMLRNEIAQIIIDRLSVEKEKLMHSYQTSKNKIGYFFIDDLLPLELATQIFENFPSINEAVKRDSLRELKYTAYQMNLYHPLMEEVIYAFQDKKVVDLIGKICHITEISPDENLYAGGLSLMAKHNFLNPHLDNSHDKNVDKWRVLNLLYYTTPNWKLQNGGNLELWQDGLKKEPTVIESKFNRLVVMATHQKSWHSVSKVEVDALRCCVSNYYFSSNPLLNSDDFHVTTFRGRPKEKIKDFVLQFDNRLRQSLRLIFKKGVRENPHQYKK